MNADSVKARLRNYAQKRGCTFQEALVYYGLERAVYRISLSEYRGHFVLKGGIFLYAVFDCNYARATTDVDLLARRISNSREGMKAVFQKIFSRDIDDALVFDTDSITVEDITEFKEYHGLHVSIVGYLDRTRIPVSIDIGFGDVIYPEAAEIDFPVMLGMEQPRVNAYTLESAIAEKLEAIIHNGYLNSRYKDFYDIYILTGKYRFSYELLRKAVVETFQNRKTALPSDTAEFGRGFSEDSVHLTRWNAFLKKKKALVNVSMTDAIERIRVFVSPLITGNVKSKWNPEKGDWE